MGACLSSIGFVYIEPTVEVTDIKVTSMGLRGINTECTLTVNNRNAKQLHGTRIVYLLQKNSDKTTLTEGVLNKDFIIPSQGSVQLTVPMTYSYSGIGAAGKSLINKGTTKLNMSGDLTIIAEWTQIGTVTIPYKGQVDIAMSDEPIY